MQTQHGSSVLAENMRVAGRLGGYELPEREASSSYRDVVDRIGGELQIDAGARPALVVLPGGVQETRTPAERDRTSGASGQHLAEATGRPTTFGWGPRFLHSTGQYHKGGPPTGVYLQVTAQPERDLAVPDRPFTFHEFLIAQAVGDGQVLTEHFRPVLRLHLASPGDLGAVRQALA